LDVALIAGLPEGAEGVELAENGDGLPGFK
jgi:hypothetical protein